MSSLFSTQLKYVFDRPVENPAWYWQAHEEGEDLFNGDDDLTAFEFIEQLCQNPGKNLAEYTNAQVGQGLEFVFNNSCSNLACGFKTAPVTPARKVAALQSLWALFEEIFEPRCSSKTAAYSQEPQPPLQGICYMFWDVCPLSGAWPAMSKMERREYYDAVAQVMEKCLHSRNLACIESGLHGLGHMVFDYEGVAAPILDRYLAKPERIPVEVRAYARAARTGMIL